MTARRIRYHPPRTVPEPTWLVATDMTQQIMSWLPLPAHADLHARFAEAMAATEAAGWNIEEHRPLSNSVFCHRAGVRRHLHIQMIPPCNPLSSMPLPSAVTSMDDWARF